MSVYVGPEPPKARRVDVGKRPLMVSSTVTDCRPPQTAPQAQAPSPRPVLLDPAMEKTLQNRWGIARPDDSAAQVIERLIIVHSCLAALEGKQCRSCKERIPRADAEHIVLLGTHKWVVF